MDKSARCCSGPDDRSTVLIVDDTPQNLSLLGELLTPHYRVRAANGGQRALRAASSPPRPDLILLDVMMPGMDGYDVIRHLKADSATADIPVIFVTAMNSTENEEIGLELGAVDYITKPVVPAVVLARVHTHLELKHARDRLKDQNDGLEREVARRMRDNLVIQDLSVRALACLAEARDNETGHHIVRTQAYVGLLAHRLADHPAFAADLAGPRLERVIKAAPLHDIGKVGIPDAILLKPGRLTPEEFRIMQTHPVIGADAIARAMDQTRLASGLGGGSSDEGAEAFEFLEIARIISLSHHEKWDGTGYPSGLAGEAIPVAGRLMALADVFDALLSRRVYKPPLSLEETTAVIIKGRGHHFDPVVVDAFVALRDNFADVARRFPDGGLPSG
ncbi:response regulator [Pararhodospirillum oryzae]|uniref:Two-component system response regulator n=1 Tax=Pararhodospirillum oryzae TaxID=478448 RepID=A0A512H6E9_9PROT|nr:two-component system response regulator [Pararhodospirillum oryzae]GEO81036.1 two-component system response regulator [Pararhodospirillum oryzae]